MSNEMNDLYASIDIIGMPLTPLSFGSEDASCASKAAGAASNERKMRTGTNFFIMAKLQNLDEGSMTGNGIITSGDPRFRPCAKSDRAHKDWGTRMSSFRS